MFLRQTSGEASGVQRERWDSLKEGSMFEGPFNNLYLVKEKSGDSITVIPLDRANIQRILNGMGGLTTLEFKTHTIDIFSVRAVPESSRAAGDLWFEAIISGSL